MGLSIEVSEAAASTPALVRLFDDYRAHYGERPDAARSQAWLSQHLGSGALVAFLAHHGDEAVGLALVAPIPASQRLGHFWQLRDLFVTQRRRRLGIGEALLRSVRETALTQGAARLSLVTESDNTAALDLYAKAGFEPAAGYVSMSLSTQPGSPSDSDGTVPDRPEIVCICGSTRFVDEMRAANRDLTLAGVIVVAPGESHEVITNEQKVALDALHLRKIDLADRVLVVNPGGYIGESTSREIAYARATGKAVSFTGPV